MPTPEIDAFLIDDENEEKFWHHGLTSARILQVLELGFRLMRNRNQRRALYLVIGRDSQGQCIAIPIEPTHAPGVWRPVTAWPCKQHETHWLP